MITEADRGNWKPADLTPGCAWALAEILHEAGLPAGLYNVVQGLGAVGAALVTAAARHRAAL